MRRKELDIFRRSVKFRMPKGSWWKEIARGGSTFTEMRWSQRTLLFLGSKEKELRGDEWEQMVDEWWLRDRISVANNLHNHVKAASLEILSRRDERRSVDWTKRASTDEERTRNEGGKRKNAVAKRRTRWNGMGLDSARLRYRNPHSQLSGCAPYGCCTR